MTAPVGAQAPFHPGATRAHAEACNRGATPMARMQGWPFGVVISLEVPKPTNSESTRQ